MTPFGGLGIGLSLVFGCLGLALVAELYYLLWWKKRIANREIEDQDYSNNYAKEFFHLVCRRKPSSSLHSRNDAQDSIRDSEVRGQEPDLELGAVKVGGEESVESELKRLHNLAGPPRFLFTIKEETKEDLESEDGKSRGDRSRKGSRTRSLSDIMLTVDNPFHSPLASPALKSPPLNPLDSYHRHGFNPLFESSAEAELNRIRSSPPPKFKFLRDAEEKLLRRLMEEADKRASKSYGSQVKAVNVTPLSENTEGSFLGFIVGTKTKERELLHLLPQYPSGSSQVLPLASSPTSFKTLDKNATVH
ncbi:hypothetical protein K2173_015794 [Erythroxylum novogranatense]|uniref:Uncharacterized protein n=1 Tax=Erythroxylum novogranatense TaxID=1862640 RepID=A0AAV8SF28_9ROSI|nr:hypothetical protein K2173_015794 [Erythroxylum novogranatense]